MMKKLSDREWKEFKIKEIFFTSLYNGKVQVPTWANIKRTELEDWLLPRITVTDSNNWIFGFFNSKSKNLRIYDNFISVSFLGSVFYHPYKASIDMKVHALIPLHIKLNRYLAEFLIKVLKNNTQNSSYGSQLSSTDLPHLKILLPIDSQWNPDYKFMEDFIKEREKIKREKYRKYVENQIKMLGENWDFRERESY